MPPRSSRCLRSGLYKPKSKSRSLGTVLSVVLGIIGIVVTVQLSRQEPRRGGPALRVLADHALNSQDLVLPGSISAIQQWPRIPSIDSGADGSCDSERRLRWAIDRGGTQAGQLVIRITAIANLDSVVLLRSIDVDVASSEPKLPGTTVGLCSGGGPVDVWRVRLDLDERKPQLTFVPPDTEEEDASASEFSLPQFQIPAGKSDEFLVYAVTRTRSLSFQLNMHFVVNGEARTIVVDDHGKPFRVTACTNNALDIDAIFTGQRYNDDLAESGGGPCSGGQL